jgi:hypothetical protein
MARKKAAHEAAQKKAAKQKKLLMILAIPMLAALVYAVMTFMSLGKKPQVSATPAAATTPAGSIPTAGSTAAPVTPGVAAPKVDSFRRFTVLARKDPFNDHGPNANAAATTTTTTTTKNKAKSGGGSTKHASIPLTGAVISFNGKKLAVAVGSKFGNAPGLSGVSLFRLVKVTAKNALIAVVGTKQQFTLHVKQPLTLEQYGGWTYKLILEPPGTAAPMTVQQPTGGN